jgi:hypothetical protein
VESTTSRKSKGLVITAFVAVIIAFIALFWAWKGLHTARLNAFIRGDLPMLDLQLQFIDINSDEIPAKETRLATETTASEKASGVNSDACPEITGGDIRESADVKVGDKLSPNCSKTVKWYVKRHPVGLSLSFSDPQKVQSYIDKDSSFNEIWRSRFIQGIFHDPLRNASIRAEDLGLQGLEGTFISRLVKESIAAHGQLHYDVVHGRQGFVYSFIRNECPYASKALPIIARVLARSGYTVPKLKEPILEMRIGLQRIFLTEYQTRVYIANGLEAMLNVMESLPPTGSESPTVPIVLAIRGEAFVDNLLRTMTGEPFFEIDLGFGLSKEVPDVLRFPAGKFGRHLRPKVFKGVFAGIPHDAFAAVVTSFYLPPAKSPEEWQQLAMEGPGDKPGNGPAEGGVAVIWDLSSEGNEITNMGVVIANQSSPDDVHRFENLFVNPKLTAACGGGTVFLAATSSPLLTRMKEACERQSLSVLDWESGSKKEEFGAQQFFFFLNPGIGMRELFLAGGAKSKDQGESNNQRQEHYEKAKAGMRTESEKVFGNLPLFIYSGNVAPSAKVVQLQGMNVRQGAAR